MHFNITALVEGLTGTGAVPHAGDTELLSLLRKCR